MEETLRDSEQRMALLLQAAPLGIHECDIDGRITFVNPSQEKITGYSADELLGTYIWDRIEPGPEKESTPDYLKHLVLEQPMPTPNFYRNIRKNGELFDIRIDWNYKRNPQGQVIGFVSIVSDITKQKMAEKALRESEERYRKLAESTTDIIYILDKEATLLYANQCAAARIGISQAEMVGKRQEDLFSPEMAKQHIEWIRQVLETGEAGKYDELFHFGPQEIWMNVRLIPLLDEQGKVDSVMGICRNITDRKQAEEALQKAHDELARISHHHYRKRLPFVA
jgi:PAS domain S-box-containing protein